MPRWTLKVVVGVFALLMVAISGTAVAHEGLSAEDELASVPQGPDKSVQYVGHVDDSEIYVAVVDNGAGLLNIYLCDGEKIGIWLHGEIEADSFTATSADGTSVAGEFGDAVASGTVTLADGNELTFAAQLAALPAGLYERVTFEGGEAVQARTIVLTDGTARGIKKKYDCAGGEKAYEVMMGYYRASTAGSGDAYIYGNLAHEEYVRGMNAGCAWASPAS